MSRIVRRAFSTILVSLPAIACGSGRDAPEEKPACREESGIACRWAGTGAEGYNGDGLDRRKTWLYWPIDLGFGPDGTPWIVDWNNHRVRRVLEDETVETVVGDFVGDGPRDLSDLTPEGAPGLEVNLNHPTDLDFFPDGQVALVSWHNHKIRRIDPETGRVYVIAGRGAGFAGDGGPFSAALLNQVKAIAMAPSGTFYLLDQRNLRIRRVDQEAMVDTLAGTGTAGYNGDGLPAGESELNFETGPNPEPSGALALAPDGSLFVADALNNRIRRIDLETSLVTTIAGTGEVGGRGDGGPALEASFNNVKDLEFGPDGRLYVADTDNHRIRAIDLAEGIIETVAGSGQTGDGRDEDVPATELNLNRPFGIAFDSEGNLYIADMFNSRIMRIHR